jgi:hypothetical protein
VFNALARASILSLTESFGDPERDPVPKEAPWVHDQCDPVRLMTGGCPDDCGYCPLAARYDTGVTAQKFSRSMRC